MDDLEWLERWYAAQCDGEWEHEHGVNVATLDNPGWMLTVSLTGTSLADRPAGPVKVVGEPPSAQNGNRGGPSWLTCQVQGGKFVGAGDSSQLRALVGVFRAWVGEQSDGRPPAAKRSKGPRKLPRR